MAVSDDASVGGNGSQDGGPVHPPSCEELIPVDFFERLEAIYKKVIGKDGEQIWALEEEATRRLVCAIAEKIRPQYRIVRPMSMGGSGVVCELENLSLSGADFGDDNIPPQKSVLKFPRPVAGQVDSLNQILYKETQKLRALNHPNLIRIEYAGREKEGGTYFYVMQYLNEPKDADDAIASDPSLERLIEILRGALAGIQYLHDAGIAHLDIKPGNIFTTDDATIVGDLGFAKQLDTPGITTGLGGTRGYQHQEQIDLISAASNSEQDTKDPNRIMRLSGVYREQIRKEWDLYAMGITLLVLLRILVALTPDSSLRYEYRYLKLMAYRLLGDRVEYAAENTGDIRVQYEKYFDDAVVSRSYLGIPAAAFSDIAYDSIHEAVEDLRKLTGESDVIKQVPELAEFQTDTIQASSLVPVPFSQRMRQMIDAREVANLTDVDQLGLVRLIYPVASHSRLEHVLGTAALAARYIRALIADSSNPLFRQVISSRNIEALLLAALVHDIGHYPLAHDLEEVEERIFHHEIRTRHLIDHGSSEVRKAIESTAWKADVNDVLAILKDDDETGRRDDSPLRVQILRSLLDGPIDADKVDYLTRDSENLRLPYGRGIDVSKLISTLTVVVSADTEGTAARIGIHEKGRIPAESVAFARYSMFGSVYWHKTHRALKAMLNRIGMEVLFLAKRANETGYVQDVREELYGLLDSADGELLSLVAALDIELVPGSRLDPMSQQIILWLAQRAGGPVPDGETKTYFEKLALDLLERRHYKRVLVISRVKPENAGRPWERVDAMFSSGKGTWETRRRATVALQGRIARLAQDWLGTAKPDHPLHSLVVRFLEENGAGAPLVLLDAPPTGRLGSSRPLEILHEPYWVADARAEISVSMIEDSSVWTALAASYPRSLGKLRVFCHPDYRQLLAAIMSRSEFENIVWEAIVKK